MNPSLAGEGGQDGPEHERVVVGEPHVELLQLHLRRPLHPLLRLGQIEQPLGGPLASRVPAWRQFNDIFWHITYEAWTT